MSNAFEVAARLDRFAANLDDSVIEPALDRGAQILKNAKDDEIQDTYARPIPLDKNGKPKWKRTGNWMQGQRIRARRGEREIVTEGPAKNYEARLARLPRGADGVNRRNPAAQRAVEIAGPQAAEAIEQEISNALRDL